MTENQFNKIHEWQKATFPAATPYSKLAHLIKELVELKNAMEGEKEHKGHFSYKVALEKTRMEFADCFFLLFGSAAAYGLDYEDICDAIEKKFEINKARIWGKPDADGVVEHTKTDKP